MNNENAVCDNINECSGKKSLLTNSDFNMISEDSHVCDHHADCIDLDGKYDCKCHIGYAGNGFECINIDECVSSTFLCPTNSGEI